MQLHFIFGDGFSLDDNHLFSPKNICVQFKPIGKRGF